MIGSTPRKFVVDNLICAAKEKEIPTFALPHGVYIYTNEFITIESRPVETFEKLNQYDHVIVQNELFKELMTRNGMQKDKIRVMGSARYCSAWMEQNKKNFPPNDITAPTGRREIKCCFYADLGEIPGPHQSHATDY